MGMTLTRDDHDRFHQEAPSLSPGKHEALMKRLGITKEQDEEWHRTHMTLDQQRATRSKKLKTVNPFALGGGFLSWCVKEGWLVQQGKDYFATPAGVRELRERFGICV
jgi:hypothetical protein